MDGINLTTYFEGILRYNSTCKYQYINMSSRIFNYSLPYIVYINVNSTDYVDEDHVIDFEKNSHSYINVALWRIFHYRVNLTAYLKNT